MNTEFLCRGKRVDTHRWVDGYYVKLLVNAVEKAYLHLIIGKNDGEYNSVDVETVGRCTGLVDKNGLTIFEGDIVENIDGIYVVKYCKSLTRFALVHDGMLSGRLVSFGTVIGNIHDNPELMGGTENDGTIN
jgi:uncharacterized phage protein (TIGR01671 family)|nr:MAG TPA: YopX protein [Caudoviricetes sp.]